MKTEKQVIDIFTKVVEKLEEITKDLPENPVEIPDHYNSII